MEEKTLHSMSCLSHESKDAPKEEEESVLMDLECVTLYKNDYCHYEHKGVEKNLYIAVPKQNAILAMDTFCVQQCPMGMTAMVDYAQESSASIYKFDMGRGQSMGDLLSSCIEALVSFNLAGDDSCKGRILLVENVVTIES